MNAASSTPSFSPAAADQANWDIPAHPMSNPSRQPNIADPGNISEDDLENAQFEDPLNTERALTSQPQLQPPRSQSLSGFQRAAKGAAAVSRLTKSLPPSTQADPVAGVGLSTSVDPKRVPLIKPRSDDYTQTREGAEAYQEALKKWQENQGRSQLTSIKEEIPEGSSSSGASVEPIRLNPKSTVVENIEKLEGVAEENPNNQALIKRINELEVELIKSKLESKLESKLDKLKGADRLSQNEVDAFIREVEAAGLRLNGMKEPKTRLYGLLSTSLKDQLKDATIEGLPANLTSQIAKALSSNNVATMVVLRDYIMSRTGRENGPDFALKVIPSIKDIPEEIKQIINENSSITEVMNILAFLLNNKMERDTSIVTEFSVESGTHDNTGKYTIQPSTSQPDTTALASVFASLTGGDRPFNIETFEVYKPEKATQGGKLPTDGIILPQGILKRNPATYDPKEPIFIKIDDIPKVISACVLQMVNILENTRQVFGGWAKLFKGMQGGSSKPKNKSKKTRRRYRRRN